jgi:hypothetical protein
MLEEGGDSARGAAGGDLRKELFELAVKTLIYQEVASLADA